MNNPALQSILNMQTVAAPQQTMQPAPNNAPAMGLLAGMSGAPNFVPSYEAGGDGYAATNKRRVDGTRAITPRRYDSADDGDAGQPVCYTEPTAG